MPQLDDLITLALTAGREIMSVRAAGFDAQTKADGSLVTIADQRAEAIIEAGLAKLEPGAPMLGEEAVAAGRIPDCGARFFCVDPLDGTRGFAKGGDEFTVNIALIENGTPIVGVVYAPATGELYAGEPAKRWRANVIRKHRNCWRQCADQRACNAAGAAARGRVGFLWPQRTHRRLHRCTQRRHHTRKLIDQILPRR